MDGGAASAGSHYRNRSFCLHLLNPGWHQRRFTMSEKPVIKRTQTTRCVSCWTREAVTLVCPPPEPARKTVPGLISGSIRGFFFSTFLLSGGKKMWNYYFWFQLLKCRDLLPVGAAAVPMSRTLFGDSNYKQTITAKPNRRKSSSEFKFYWRYRELSQIQESLQTSRTIHSFSVKLIKLLTSASCAAPW